MITCIFLVCLSLCSYHFVLDLPSMWCLVWYLYFHCLWICLSNTISEICLWSTILGSVVPVYLLLPVSDWKVLMISLVYFLLTFYFLTTHLFTFVFKLEKGRPKPKSCFILWITPTLTTNFCFLIASRICDLFNPVWQAGSDFLIADWRNVLHFVAFSYANLGPEYINVRRLITRLSLHIYTKSSEEIEEVVGGQAGSGGVCHRSESLISQVKRGWLGLAWLILCLRQISPST